MISGKLLIFLSLLALVTMALVLIVGCEDSGEQKIKFVGEDEEDEEIERTCEETFDFLYNDCGRPLTDTLGLPIEQKDATLGCEICVIDNTKYPLYCCIYDCANTNRTCDGKRGEEGMIDCTRSCLGMEPADDDTADDDTTDDDTSG